MSQIRSSPKWTMSKSTPKSSLPTPGPQDYTSLDVHSCRTRREPSCIFGTARGHMEKSDSVNSAESTRPPSQRSVNSSGSSPAAKTVTSCGRRGSTFGTSGRELERPRFERETESSARKVKGNPKCLPGPGAYSPQPSSTNAPKVSNGMSPRIRGLAGHCHGAVDHSAGQRSKPDTRSPAWRFSSVSRGLLSATAVVGPGPGSYQAADAQRKLASSSPRHSIRGRHTQAYEPHDVQFLPQFSQFC